jgi:hypothetical protein
LKLGLFIFLLLQLFLLHFLQQESVLLTLDALGFLQACLLRSPFGLQVGLLLLDSDLQHLLPLLCLQLLKFVELFDEILVRGNYFGLAFLRLN